MWFVTIWRRVCRRNSRNAAAPCRQGTGNKIPLTSIWVRLHWWCSNNKAKYTLMLYIKRARNVVMEMPQDAGQPGSCCVLLLQGSDLATGTERFSRCSPVFASTFSDISEHTKPTDMLFGRENGRTVCEYIFKQRFHLNATPLVE